MGSGKFRSELWYDAPMEIQPMPVYQPTVSKELLAQISCAEEMHNFVLANVPDRLVLDADEKTVLVALFSLTIERPRTIRRVQAEASAKRRLTVTHRQLP
jgi:hypothetical protein